MQPPRWLCPPPPPHTHARTHPTACELQELRDLIRRLLVRVPAKRLGCGPGGAVELKAHPWFRGLDWDALAARRLRAPYVPQARGYGRGPCGWGERASATPRTSTRAPRTCRSAARRMCPTLTPQPAIPSSWAAAMCPPACSATFERAGARSRSLTPHPATANAPNAPLFASRSLPLHPECPPPLVLLLIVLPPPTLLSFSRPPQRAFGGAFARAHVDAGDRPTRLRAPRATRHSDMRLFPLCAGDTVRHLAARRMDASCAIVATPPRVLRALLAAGKTRTAMRRCWRGCRWAAARRRECRPPPSDAHAAPPGAPRAQAREQHQRSSPY